MYDKIMMVIDMVNIFEKYKAKYIDYIKEKNNVKIAYLFGSFADGTYNENSDIDIAIIYKSDIDDYDHAGESIEISKIFGDVDVDYIKLDKANIFLQFEILSKGLLIYCDDDEYLEQYMKKVQEQYIEMNYHKKNYINYIINTCDLEGE